MKNYFTIITFLSLINLSFANQEDDPKSNLNLLVNLLNSTLNELKNNGALQEKDSVFIQITSNDSSLSRIQKSIVTDIILNKLKMTVFTNSDNNNLFGKLVVFRWVEWSIFYEKKSHRFWQKKKYQRNLKADFFVEVLNRRDNKVLFSKNVKWKNIGLITGSDLHKIQNPEYNFTMGKVVNKKGILKKWLEPVFLFAISGAVIYLFYSVRTQ